MEQHEFDLFVIGTGPAGLRAAIQAAKLGKQVGICEKQEVVGGVCLNTGTIPSKTLREAVFSFCDRRRRRLLGQGQVVPAELTMTDLLGRCREVIQREAHVLRDQLRRNRVTVLAGRARFLDPHRIAVEGAVGGAEVRAESVVIATGTVPARPSDVPVDGRNIVTSNMILELDEIPRALTVVGGGVIGTEYASIFASLGVEVTLIDQRDRLLPFLDAEIGDALMYQMRGLNCTLRLGEAVSSVVTEEPGRVVANLASGKKVVADLLLYSIGRVGATGDLDLPAAGLETNERGLIEVGEQYRTPVPHIYAVGDVIGYPSLASTSMEQGRCAACHAFGVATTSLPELFPYGIYSIPEISMVGPTERELTEASVPYEVGIARYREIARGAILGDDTGLLKILFHRESRKILAVHAIGTGATELIHIGQAVLAHGGTLDYFVTSVFNYPTFAECYKVAALDGYNKVGPPHADPPPPGSGVALQAPWSELEESTKGDGETQST